MSQSIRLSEEVRNESFLILLHYPVQNQINALTQTHKYVLLPACFTTTWYNVLQTTAESAVFPGSAQEPAFCILLPMQGFGSAGLSKRQFVTAHPLPHQAQSYTTDGIYNRLSLLHKYLYQRKQWKDKQKLIRLVTCRKGSGMGLRKE